ncbi:MAG: hypothetical protein K2J28_10555, partial [Duncaniella sp.]|nr:hypothetical protein [Duncaniella sp.]
FHCFLPVRKISYGFPSSGETDGARSLVAPEASAKYDGWFNSPEFFGEVQAVFSLPFGSVSAYGNYTSAHDNNWNFGISIGAFLLAPRFFH